MYSFPSSSKRCEPSPRLMKRGVPPTPRHALTGEFTPPGMESCARSKSSWERSSCTDSRILNGPRSTGPASVVDALHDFERVTAFFPGNQRFALIPDGIGKVEELALERFQGDGHGVGCAGSYFA